MRRGARKSGRLHSRNSCPPSSMKVLLDMNLWPRWRTLLEREHIDAVHWSEVGRVDAEDTEIMAYAMQHDYIVLSQDLDFSTILAATSGLKPSVVQLRSDNLDPDVIGSTVLAAGLWDQQGLISHWQTAASTSMQFAIAPRWAIS